jgi:hypothetical protein
MRTHLDLEPCKGKGKGKTSRAGPDNDDRCLFHDVDGESRCANLVRNTGRIADG